MNGPLSLFFLTGWATDVWWWRGSVTWAESVQLQVVWMSLPVQISASKALPHSFSATLGSTKLCCPSRQERLTIGITQWLLPHTHTTCYFTHYQTHSPTHWHDTWHRPVGCHVCECTLVLLQLTQVRAVFMFLKHIYEELIICFHSAFWTQTQNWLVLPVSNQSTCHEGHSCFSQVCGVRWQINDFVWSYEVVLNSVFLPYW